MLEQLGKMYAEGEYVVREGEAGDCMYVIQSGQAEVVRRVEDKEFSLNLLEEGDFFGEMALFDRAERSASVRAVGELWVLTLEKKSFLRRVRQDPVLAFRILERMAKRIRELDEQLVRLGASMANEAEDAHYPRSA